ncbi:MAG: SPOR domain-containing protein [Pseudomonadota bacterium]
MAAINFDDFGDRSDSGTLATVLNWGGALLSVLLIAGLATWGWKLWVRDVTGVPVVAALEGPMRIAPEDPGGLASNYQGLTVNRIAEERVDVAPLERVVLAPAPATLDESEDLAMAEMPAVPEVGSAITLEEEEAQIAASLGTEAEALRSLDGTETLELESTTTAAFDTLPDATPLPLAEPDNETAAVESVTEPAPAAAEEAPSATDLAVAAALADVGLRPEPAVKVEAAAHVPVVTPRPLVRPASLQRVSVASSEPAAPAAASAVAEPATIAAGTRLVQLGAYASSDIAETEWAALQSRFSDIMVDKSIVVQQAQAGGRNFYRLRAMGFDDLADARRFCSVMVSEGANCIPVVQN